MVTAQQKQSLKLAVLGFGNMGEAIVRALLGAISAGASTHWGQLYVYDPSESRRAAGANLKPVTWSATALEAVQAADLLLLAVKPQTMAKLLEAIASAAAGRLVVSVAAGITTSQLESHLPGARVVRAMPNTPLLAGKGLVALCGGTTASAEDIAIARRLFPGAMLLEVDERMLDAVTAVSASGPAYFFAFVEALATAAREQGFDAETAYRLAAGTFIGAAALLEQSGASAHELRRRVTSPGGTTEAALKVFAERGLEQTVREAVAAATRRGRELSRSPS